MSERSPLGRSREIAADAFRSLHPNAIEGRDRVLAVLERLRRHKVELWRGMNRRIDRETARVDQIRDDRIVLRIRNFDWTSSRQVFLNFVLNRRPYFFSTWLLNQPEERRVEIAIPAAIHHSERRDRLRVATARRRVELSVSGRAVAEGHVMDWSPTGLCVAVPEDESQRFGPEVSVRFLEGEGAGKQLFADIRHERREDGWVRLGLDCSTIVRSRNLAIESRNEIVESTLTRRAERRWKVLSAGVQIASDRMLRALGRGRRASAAPKVIDYENRLGERIRAIVDSTGETRGAPAVIIPPAWGRTKETLMPLALCIVESFRAAGEPIVVVRFDGIRKRGESHNDPGCKGPGADHHRFTFSQGARDITATIDYLAGHPDYRPPRVVLVSFSAAALEARRAVANDRRITDWISVVGTADLQSMMRVISGGVDYVGGLERGVRFGLQEVLGVEVDIDHAGLDAFQHEMAYLEDARRDMARITVPITWIHGRHDAWMDSERVKDALSRGDTTRRRFIEVPTGHMLKSSREALETFELIVAEISRMALGRKIDPKLPSGHHLEQRRRAERERLPKENIRTREFWRSYLVGRDETLGIELMTNISPYLELMDGQIEALQLSPHDTVVDLGAGTGSLPLRLAQLSSNRDPIRVIECDYVREGLDRTRARLQERNVLASPLRVEFLECDLDLVSRGAGVPLATGSVSAALASLLLSYLADPKALLREIHRILRPGGRLVVSSLRRDADISKLYTEGIVELKAGRAREVFGEEAERRVEEAARAHLNQAARLLDLEEKGVFRFWDAPELAQLLRQAGFRSVSTRSAFGDPPQAVIATARRA